MRCCRGPINSSTPQLTSYFAPNAGELPLLHTWSPSIEWQYYLVFPAAFLEVRRIAGPKWLLPTMLAIAGTFFLVGTLDAKRPEDAYFSALSRAFEFLLGAVAAFARPTAPGRGAANAIAAFSVIALTGIAITFMRATPFPGTNALVVCLLGTLPILFAANSTYLSNPLLVYLGQRSYSLYLWHWPLIAISNYLQLSHLPYFRSLALLSILGFSEFSYRVVERPFIRLDIGLARSFLLLFALPLALSAIVFGVAAKHDGFPARLGPEMAHAYANTKRFDQKTPGCEDFDGAGDVERCVLGDPRSADRALLIGPSHARHYWMFVDGIAKQAHVKVYGLTSGGCLALDRVSFLRAGEPYTTCKSAVNAYYNMIRTRKYKCVFIGQRWIGYPQSQLQLLEHSVTAIINGGAIPVILKPVPENGDNIMECFYRHLKLRTAYRDECDIRLDNSFAPAEKQFVDTLIDEVRAQHPSTIVIDPQRVQCDSQVCQTTIDGTTIYKDTHHLSDFGSATPGEQYVRTIGNPLTGK